MVARGCRPMFDDRVFVVNLHVSDNQEWIQLEAEVFIDIAKINTNPLYYAVAGYDDDPRQLWEIAEVVVFLRAWLAQVKVRGGHGLDRLTQAQKALLLLACGKAKVIKNPAGGSTFYHDAAATL